MKHQSAWQAKAKKGVKYHMDWRPDEDKLMLEAGKIMGEYLDSIGRTIEPGLTPEEWLQALRCYTQAYCEGRGTSFDELNDEIPF
jgi:hypothetical protein